MLKLIKGTGRLVVSTVDLLETGVNALNEAAEELKHSTEVWAAEEQVNLQKKRIERLQAASPRELSEAYQTLVAHLECLRSLKPHDSSVKDQLADARSHWVKQETQRNTVDEEYYPDGGLKRRLPRRDGRLHGQCIEWYSDGSKRWEVRFEYGKVNGKGAFWYPDQSTWLEYQFESGMHNFSALFWPENRAVLVKIEGVLSRSGKMRVELLYRGVRLGAVKAVGGQIRSSRQLFFLVSACKFMVRPWLWGGWKEKVKDFNGLYDQVERTYGLLEEIIALT